MHLIFNVSPIFFFRRASGTESGFAAIQIKGSEKDVRQAASLDYSGMVRARWGWRGRRKKKQERNNVRAICMNIYLHPHPIWHTIANNGNCTAMCDGTGAWHADSLQNRPHERHRMAKEAAGGCEDTHRREPRSTHSSSPGTANHPADRSSPYCARLCGSAVQARRVGIAF